MSSYRLLRSNKESGPYTQEEMIAMGFKPYDLIWVEGKSAGWRYPSEIPELRNYAPVVEEQPYDRFFKKPVVPARGTPLPRNIIEPVLEMETVAMPVAEAAPLAASIPAYAPVAAMPAVETSRPVFSPAAASVGRHIHVTLPSGNTLNVTTLPGRAMPAPEKSVQPPTEEKPASFATTLSAQPHFAPVDETVPGRRNATAAMATVPAQAANDSSHYYPGTSSAAAGFSWTTVIGMVTGIATLVGLGIMIGLSINRSKPEIAAVTSVKENVLAQPVQSIHRQGPPAAQAPADNTTGNTHTPLVADRPPVNSPAVKPPPPQQQQQAIAGKNAGSHARVLPAAKKEIKAADNKPVDKPAPVPASKEKEPVVVRPRPTEAMPAVNLEKQVNIHTNGYKVGAFGGISDIQCTLVNDSRYALESVDVELQYIQANDKVFKTEKLSFRDVAAGAQVTQNAPKSPRGIKIISRIVKINTREPGLASITIKS
jgi:hypothetical protein